jgi:predicted nucleic acid-binding protein
VQDVLFVLAPFLPSVEIHAPLRDPDDAPVVSTAIQAAVDVIVTGDQDLLGDQKLVAWLSAHGIEVLTPAILLERLSEG